MKRVRVGNEDRLWVDSVEGLLALVEAGVVELHPWNVTVDDLEHPDLLVFSIGSGRSTDWKSATEIAVRLRALLQAEGLESWPKLTGGPELHAHGAHRARD